MSWYAPGNTPINSTQAPVVAPSTSDLIAELDSTQLGTAQWSPNRQMDYRVFWVVGASTNVIWQLEHATSTDLSSALDTFYPLTASGQSAEFVVTWRLRNHSRIRARLYSTGATASAFIQAEPLV